MEVALRAALEPMERLIVDKVEMRGRVILKPNPAVDMIALRSDVEMVSLSTVILMEDSNGGVAREGKVIFQSLFEGMALVCFEEEEEEE
jgi:hypothetical protein